MVRLPADAGQGGPAGRAGSSPRRSPRARDIVARLRRRPGADPGDPARASTTSSAADRAAGARAGSRDGQRRRADEGHRHPARGLRQAAHRARRSSCCWSPSPTPGGRTEQLIDEPRHRATTCASCTASPTPSWSTVMGSAEIACVPSLYEGFSLPTAELMACATPLVVSRAGAIPEVVGPDGLCADLVTPGDVGELSRALARAARRPGAPGADGRRRPGAGRWSGSAGGPSAAATAAAYEEVIADYQREREEPHVLTVDFDRLGLRPGERVLDMGCGAGRHAFEMYRRGADVIAFDQDADELAGVRELFAAMREAGEVPAGRRGRRQGGRRARAAVRRRRVRPGRRRRGPRAHPRRHPGDRRAGPGAAARRHDGAHGAALAARGHLLEAVRRLPQHRGRPHPDLHRRGAGRPRRRTPGWCYDGHATTPTACTRRTGGSSARSASTTTTTRSCRAYHRLLVWDIMKRPAAPPGCAERVLNPLIGKSLVLYFRKPDAA